MQSRKEVLLKNQKYRTRMNIFFLNPVNVNITKCIARVQLLFIHEENISDKLSFRDLKFISTQSQEEKQQHTSQIK